MACKDMHGEIGGKPVYIRQWSATVALENLSAALNLFGAALLPYITGENKFTDNLILLRSGSAKEITDLLKRFVTAVRVDGKELNSATFDIEYGGDLNRIFETFAFACQVNYKDFFEQGADQPQQDPEQDQQAQQEQEAEVLRV
ncbi:MAG: phage tail assembly chaperone [Bacteroidales bacterium]